MESWKNRRCLIISRTFSRAFEEEVARLQALARADVFVAVRADPLLLARRHQVITNACASIAILNAVMNLGGELGEELSNLRDFSEGLDPESKGWTISNSEKIRAGKST